MRGFRVRPYVYRRGEARAEEWWCAAAEVLGVLSAPARVLVSVAADGAVVWTLSESELESPLFGSRKSWAWTRPVDPDEPRDLVACVLLGAWEARFSTPGWARCSRCEGGEDREAVCLRCGSGRRGRDAA